MKSVKLITVILAAVTFFSACNKKPEIANTSTVKMSGEWFVQLYDVDGNELLPTFDKISTYNTSDPTSGQIWVDDLGHIWPFKGKFPVDYSILAFKPADALDNISEPGESIKITEGKVLPNAAHSKSGNLVDSIFMKLEFSDDPGTVYSVGGHFRTGFFEDEY